MCGRWSTASWNRGRPLPPRSILLTFDDAYESVLTEAVPVLDRLGIRGVIGVVERRAEHAHHHVSDQRAARPLMRKDHLGHARPVNPGDYRLGR